jgi:FKBP-type peptidyl-prolyl cis-trans isomerase
VTALARVRRSSLAAVAALSAVVASCAGAGAGAPPEGDFLATTAFGLKAEVHAEELTRHARGFHYRDVALGTGPEAVGGRTVHVSYVVRLADGREVDRAEPAAPLRFRVGDGSMIAALDAGVRGMRAGGTRQLVIPPRLGYGARGRGPVPPHAVLVMMVTVERVE